MAFNFSTLLTGLKTVASHDATQSGALSGLLVGGLYIAEAAGVAITPWEFTVAGIAGGIIYGLLPKKIQSGIGNVVKEAQTITTEIPTIYSNPSDFPNPPPSPTPNNINSSTNGK